MSTWMLKQWPVPLVAATALVVMLAVQRFGVHGEDTIAGSTSSLQGNDADAIRLRFAAAEQIAVGTRGELLVRTPTGEVIHHVPVAYQRDHDGQLRLIDARFVQIAPHELRFELGD